AARSPRCPAADTARRARRDARERSDGRRGCRRSTPGRPRAAPATRTPSGRPRSSCRLTVAADELCESGQDVRISLRENAVPEVEDVTGSAACPPENVERSGFCPLPWADQHRRLEIPLDRAVLSDDAPGVVEGDAPVDA